MTQEVFQVLPAYGVPGVCADYDADCAAIKDKPWCFLNPAHRNEDAAGNDIQLSCPFLD